MKIFAADRRIHSAGFTRNGQMRLVAAIGLTVGFPVEAANHYEGRKTA